MRLVVYRGPGHVLRAGSRTLYRGEPASISEELWKRLSGMSHVRVEELEPALVPDPEDPDPESPADEAEDTADNGEEESD